MKPMQRPRARYFSSGPCAKRPGWSPDALKDAVLGRSHRSGAGKAKLKAAIDQTRQLLGVPDAYRIAIVPASDTGAVEMALWSLLGARGVTLLSWESFGAGWVTDVIKQLKLDGAWREDQHAVLRLAAQHLLPAVCHHIELVPGQFHGESGRGGIADGQPRPVAGNPVAVRHAHAGGCAVPAEHHIVVEVDVGEVGQQTIVRLEQLHAVERLESHAPAWPLPKIFRLTKGGKLIEDPFKGETINTPSMLCVEDYLDALRWADNIGGLPALVVRSKANLQVVENWVASTPWVDFLAVDPATRSCTSVCLSIVDDWFTGLGPEDQGAAAKRLVQVLEDEGVAYDIGAYRDAPAGLRIWCGATVEQDDLAALLPWLDWAFGEVKATYRPAA